jgi:hypothetical protein
MVRILGVLLALLVTTGTVSAQQPPGPPPQPPTGGAPMPPAQRPLHPLQEQQRQQQRAQVAQARQHAPDFVLGGAYNGPATDQAAAANRATAQRLASGDTRPPGPGEFTPTYNMQNRQGPQHPRRGEEPSPERALRLLGLGGLVDIKDALRWDGLPERVEGAPDDQAIDLPGGYCTLSSYIWENNANAWNLPTIYGIGFQACQVLPGINFILQTQNVYLFKCGYFFQWLNLCFQPSYYWYYTPPGECVSYTPDLSACGPGRFYAFEDGAFIVRDYGYTEVSDGWGAGYRDSTILNLQVFQ